MKRPSGKSKRAKVRAVAIAKSEDLQGFVTELEHETDRAAAILAGSMLDELLRQALEMFFVDEPKEVDLLLNSEQPLGSFGARIRTAYCLGMLTSDEFTALGLVKAIRNYFAHELHGLSFDDPDMATKCSRLKSLVFVPTFVATSSRRIFLLAVHSLMFTLEARKQSAELYDRRRVPVVEMLFHFDADEQPVSPVRPNDRSVPHSREPKPQ
jgi:mannitol operon repressor